MTDPAQAELVYHVVTMAGSGFKSAQKKRVTLCKQMPYTDKGLACARQKLTFQKFKTGLTLLFKLPFNH
jgi:hypothetical protein